MATRTTGAKFLGEPEESALTRVQDKDYLTASERLYMTAASRVHEADVKQRTADDGVERLTTDDELIASDAASPTGNRAVGPHPGASKPVHSARMSGVGHHPTAPEIALRKLLYAEGFRYRVNYKVPDRPRRTIDVAFPGPKVAVFLDGCFWHSCPEHGTSSRSNSEWWDAKLAGNLTRDRDTDAALRSAGWVVVRIWEHVPADEALVRVREALGR